MLFFPCPRPLLRSIELANLVCTDSMVIWGVKYQLSGDKILASSGWYCSFFLVIRAFCELSNAQVVDVLSWLIFSCLVEVRNDISSWFVNMFHMLRELWAWYCDVFLILWTLVLRVYTERILFFVFSPVSPICLLFFRLFLPGNACYARHRPELRRGGDLRRIN